jgi:hypothetical protein
MFYFIDDTHFHNQNQDQNQNQNQAALVQLFFFKEFRPIFSPPLSPLQPFEKNLKLLLETAAVVLRSSP